MSIAARSRCPNMGICEKSDEFQNEIAEKYYFFVLDIFHLHLQLLKN